MRVCVALLLVASALPAQTVIRGTVRDMAGFPIEGVRVSARMEGTAIVLGRVTQSDGEFIFTLLPGAYSVTTDRASDKQHIDVAAGEETELDLAVPGNATIGGRVLDSERQPVKGAYVWLLTSEYSWGFLQYANQKAYTDANGAYTFSNRLQSNRRYYVLAARPANGQPLDTATENIAPRVHVEAASPLDIPMEERQPIQVPTYYPSTAQFDAASPIVLRPGEQRGGVDIKLTAAPYYCVDGKIRDKAFTIEQTAAAVPNARGRAGGNGGYRFCGLTAGSYRLVTKDGAAGFTVSNADVHGVDLTSPPARLLLESDANTPAPDGHAPEISAIQQQFAPNRMLLLASQTSAAAVLIGAMGGEVVLRHGAGETDVPAGEYAVIAAAPGESLVEIWYNGVKLLDPVIRVTQGVAGTLRVEAAPSTCALNVTIADGPDATAIVVPDYVISAGQLARLAHHGGNDFKLPPGKYRVLATAQTIRWNVPDDLEKLLPAILQGELVDLDGQTPVQITVKPVTIY
jgi:Carboxypeptidase regulatory-like domain